MAVEITFLGTGGSPGIPQIGCLCAVCRSADPRNTRTRSSVCIRRNAGAGLPPGRHLAYDGLAVVPGDSR